VGEAVPEGVEEGRGPVLAADAKPQVGVPDVEVEAELRHGVEKRSEIGDVGERTVEVLDHQSEPAGGRVFCEIRDSGRVLGPHLGPLVQRDTLVGVHVDPLHACIPERVETATEEVSRQHPHLRPGGRDRQVVGGVAHRLEAEIGHQAPDLLAVGLPRHRGLDGEIDEVESVLVDPMDLLEDGASGEVHGTDQHRGDDDTTPSLILTIMETYEAIVTRRSVGKCTDRVPDRAAVERLIEAATAAPNHHLTEPWRFIVIAGDALKELGEAWAAGEERTGGNSDAAREKPLRAPVILTVVERPRLTHPKVIEIEEHHAVGAAIQNILLAAHDMGLAAMLRTGPAARLHEVHEYLGLSAGEIIAGFVYLGYKPDDYDKKAPRKTPTWELTQWRGWD
jgi:nitroreductase